MRLPAPLWLAVSVLLLLVGLGVVDDGDPKGRAVLIAVGAFGALCSLAMMAHRRIRGRRDHA